MFVDDESGEKTDRKENKDPSGEESFMLRPRQTQPLDRRSSTGLELSLCELKENKDLGEDMLAFPAWSRSRRDHRNEMRLKEKKQDQEERMPTGGRGAPRCAPET